MSLDAPSTPTATAALIAAAGVVIGATVTALASAFSARQKIREVELVYQQKLRDNYLTNARQYLEGVYLPLTISLGSLGDAFQVVRQFINYDAGTIDPARGHTFELARDHYLQEIDGLFARGGDAFLTSAIEIRLRSFNNFLRASATAMQPVVQVVVQVTSGMSPIFPKFGGSMTKKIRGSFAAGLYGLGSSTSILGFGISYNAEELVAAPLVSRQFERRIVEEIAGIKFLIKEVTLGSHAGN